MALTTGVNVAARPGRVGALGLFAIDAGRFGDAVRVVLAAIDRHHRGRLYAPRRVDRISRFRRPVIPVAPARHRVLPAPPPRGASETGPQARARRV
jgi:hypothetical protein